ncbi:hypothetical protein K466DRAFT_230170 [Polyporus arcularius HHB13444]|uniref:Uncharacterized protein n=1 Tax=Polyporus arcularius HHB13444 TaxID=1314778 RepID=A0A5C3P3Q3_9APHY|nr:hypothetical protein K466DRAFT_230170 [Polyporus arcularius HHB13444]
MEMRGNALGADPYRVTDFNRRGLTAGMSLLGMLLSSLAEPGSHHVVEDVSSPRRTLSGSRASWLLSADCTGWQVLSPATGHPTPQAAPRRTSTSLALARGGQHGACGTTGVPGPSGLDARCARGIRDLHEQPVADLCFCLCLSVSTTSPGSHVRSRARIRIFASRGVQLQCWYSRAKTS